MYDTHSDLNSVDEVVSKIVNTNLATESQPAAFVNDFVLSPLVE